MIPGSVSSNAATLKFRAANPWERARARPRFPMPAITTGQTRSRPSCRSIWSMRKAASYPAPRVPKDPRSERSLRTLAAFTRAAEASTSEETVAVPDRRISSRMRW